MLRTLRVMRLWKTDGPGKPIATAGVDGFMSYTRRDCDRTCEQTPPTGFYAALICIVAAFSVFLWAVLTS